MVIHSAVETIVHCGFAGMYRACERALHELLALPAGTPGSLDRMRRDAALGLFLELKLYTSPQGVARINAAATKLGRPLKVEEIANLMARFG